VARGKARGNYDGKIHGTACGTTAGNMQSRVLLGVLYYVIVYDQLRLLERSKYAAVAYSYYRDHFEHRDDGSVFYRLRYYMVDVC
jgi:hypothetical protein